MSEEYGRMALSDRTEKAFIALEALNAITLGVSDLEEAFATISDYIKAADRNGDADKRVPEGYVIVPVEPTEDMIKAIVEVMASGGWAHDVYKAMIKAAQKEI